MILGWPSPWPPARPSPPARVAIGTSGVAIPLCIHLFMPQRGRGLLIELRDWMVRENATIIAVMCLIIAAKLLGDALTSLTR